MNCQLVQCLIYGSKFVIGLRYIEEMTSQYTSELRLDMTSDNGTHVHEIFQNFSLSKYPNFTLHLGKLSYVQKTGKFK